MSARTAEDHVRVPRALEELPVTTKAFASRAAVVLQGARDHAGRDPEDRGPARRRRDTVRHRGTLDRIVAGCCTVKRNLDPDRGRAQLRRRGVWLDNRRRRHRNADHPGRPRRGGHRSCAARTLAAKELPELVDEPDFRGAAKRFDGLRAGRPHRTLEPDRTMAPAAEVVVHADLDGADRA